MIYLRLIALAVLLFTHSAPAQQLPITNGGFESGLNNWTVSGNFYANSGQSFPHTGQRYLYLSNPNNTAGDNLFGTCYQQFTIPENATAATLSYYWNVSSTDSATVVRDVLTVAITSSNGLQTLMSLDGHNNTDQTPPGNPNYHLAAFNILQVAGEQVRLRFVGTTNDSLPTVFRVDDVRIEVTLPGTIAASPSLLSRTVMQGQNAPAQTLTISNTGGWAGIDYTITDNRSWLSVSPTTGATVNVPQEHTITYSTAGLGPGEYSGTITITDPDATNSPVAVPVALTVNGPQGPANDSCSNAAALAVGSTPFSTLGATTDPPVPATCPPQGNTIGSDVWYSYTAPADGTLTVDTCGSGLDTVLVVYSGTSCPVTNGRQLTCDDDSCGFQSIVATQVTGGSTYRIRLGGYNGATGSGTLHVLFVAGAPCASGLVRDCNGNCAPGSWVGDGYCDDGYYAYNGIPIHFDCAQFGNDGGDCAASLPPIMNPPNHDEPESPPQCAPLAAPMPGQNKLIIVTHGWVLLSPDSYDQFWVPLRDAIRMMVDSEWQVEAYDWTEDARSVWPALAVANGACNGFCLAEQIIQNGYQHVHLIGHSAGAALIAAAASRLYPTSTTVHTTYLDAFATAVSLPRLGGFEMAYGGNAQWSEHYFSQDPITPCGGTGVFTQLHLPRCFNVDVSLVDPAFDALCFSSHAWPRCYYGYSVDATEIDDCAMPAGGDHGYGFRLAFEQWSGEDGFDGWLAERLSDHAPNADCVVELPDGCSGESMIYESSTAQPFDLDLLTSFANSDEQVQTVAGVLTMTTEPPGMPGPSPAWINFQITTAAPVNFIAFDMAFEGVPGAAGLLTMYVNGTKCGMLDERYAMAGMQYYRLPTPGELTPGEHFLSFRLDHFNQLTSSVTIDNIATGFGEFVPACRADFDGNEVVQVPDIFAFLSAWFAQDQRADFDGVPGVTVPDIFAFLRAWFAGCS